MTQTTIARPEASALERAVQGAADRLVEAGAASVQFRVARGRSPSW